jgi:hypothetical protein
MTRASKVTKLFGTTSLVTEYKYSHTTRDRASARQAKADDPRGASGLLHRTIFIIVERDSSLQRIRPTAHEQSHR